jgi:hypothetical protein
MSKKQDHIPINNIQKKGVIVKFFLEKNESNGERINDGDIKREPGL